MDVFYDFFEYILKHRGQWHNFCSAVQFSSRCRRFWARFEEAKDGAGKTEVFGIAQTPLFYIREHGSYLQNQSLKRPWHSSVVQQTILFTRKGFPFNCMLTRVSYDASDDIKLTHLGCTDQMCNIWLLTQEELVFRSDSSATGSRARLPPAERNKVWIKNVIYKSILPGGLV